jgi:hypothetical protein
MKTLVATIVAASALVFIRPVFAETYAGYPVSSSDSQESSMEPSFEEPWHDGPQLAPAPQTPMEPEPGSMYVPPPPVGLIDGVGHPPMNPDLPELMPSPSLGIASGGFHPEGGFRR